MRHVLNGPQILEMRQVVRMVPLAPHVQEYVVKLVLATHSEDRANTLANKYIRYGSSPRGAQALILGGKVRALLNGRFNVSTGRYSRAAEAGPAPPHHLEFRSPGGWPRQPTICSKRSPA